jgi:hypothetical protein
MLSEPILVVAKLAGVFHALGTQAVSLVFAPVRRPCPERHAVRAIHRSSPDSHPRSNATLLHAPC